MTMRALARAVTVAVALLCAAPHDALAQAGRRGDVLDVNTASEKQLQAIPGITPAVAATLAGRRPFQTMTDVDAALAASLGAPQRSTAYARLFLQVNLNTASDDELRLIPGVNDAVRAAITSHRPYETLAQFKRDLRGTVDDKELGRLEAYVYVPIDLNSASDSDIMSIPRMGQRMLKEFKEYRPYKAMAQFRREIGKYVDDKEVARLERYVTIR